ncbi:MAG: hypothetical protein SWK76_06615 [Actinomycetota bacterium]|nr:hypothetical protein [Actinomycetota bacterium]
MLTLLLGPASAGTAIAITPTRIPASLLPGEGQAMEVKLINKGTEEVSLLPRVMTVKEHSDGMPLLEPDGTCSWFSLEEEAFQLTPSQSELFAFSVTVPPGVDPGPYHFAVTFETFEEGMEGIGLTGGLAVLVDLVVLTEEKGDDTGMSGVLQGFLAVLAVLLVGLMVLVVTCVHRSRKSAEQEGAKEEEGR